MIRKRETLFIFEGKNLKKNSMLELVNHEGPNLKANFNRETGFFEIYDQFDEKIYMLNPERMGAWLEGEFAMIDSEGNEWFYTQQSEDARVSMEDLIYYLIQK
jgi:hypothetical protein